MSERWRIFPPSTIRWHLRGVQLYGWRFAWHWFVGHPEDQLCYPWCNCMEVFNVECDDD